MMTDAKTPETKPEIHYSGRPTPSDDKAVAYFQGMADKSAISDLRVTEAHYVRTSFADTHVYDVKFDLNGYSAWGQGIITGYAPTEALELPPTSMNADGQLRFIVFGEEADKRISLRRKPDSRPAYVPVPDNSAA